MDTLLSLRSGGKTPLSLRAIDSFFRYMLIGVEESGMWL